MDTPASDGTTPPPLNNSPKTNSEKASVNSLLTVNSTNNTEALTIEPTQVLGIRVPYSYYVIYNRKLSGEEKELVREALKQFFISLVKNVKRVNYNINVNNVNSSYSFNINIINVTQQQSQVKEEADEFTAERIKQLKLQLREAREVLQEYRVKAQKYDEIKRLVELFRKGTIDVKTLLNRILSELGEG
ncbi:MAG: hypothetical protein QXZ63_06660 [Sulfolobales archaeon]